MSNQQPTSNALIDKQSAATSKYIDPTHDYNKYLNTKPKKDFNYKKYTYKNQEMIIAQLSQYLSITKTHTALIPKIQQGICVYLSNYFLNRTLQQWNEFIEQCLDWDGHSEMNGLLVGHFNRLINLITQGNQDVVVYLGDVVDFEALLKKNKSYKFTNSWHMIAVKQENDRIFIYDPNYSDGYKQVNASDVSRELRLYLGNIIGISVSNTDPMLKEKSNWSLSCPDVFIEEGGLGILLRAYNYQLILDACVHNKYSMNSLNGLLLISNSDLPLWVKGLVNSIPEIKKFTRDLLQQFINSQPKDEAIRQLKHSISELNLLNKLQLITLLAELDQLSQDKPSVIQQLIIDLRVQTKKDDYRKQLQVDRPKVQEARTIMQYCLECLREPEDMYHKRLIELDSINKVRALQLHLQQIASRPVFFIDSAHLLICSSKCIKLNSDNTGTLGVGGQLNDFLNANYNNKPILIIDCTEWPAEDLISSNTLLDEEPRTSLGLLPPKTSIIVLRSYTHPNYYQGDDFNSRFDQRDYNPVLTDELSLPDIWETKVTVDNYLVIDLFNSIDWKDELCGRWQLNGSQYYYKNGLLNNVQQPILFKNAPWYEKNFQHFLLEAKSKQGVITDSNIVHLPQDLIIIKGPDGYAWEQLITTIVSPMPQVTLPSNTHVLNSTCFNTFFECYEFINDELYTQPGLLYDDSTQVHSIYVTQTISDDQWAKLLTTSKDLNKQLQIWCAPGVELPQALTDAPIIKDVALQSKTVKVLISSDPDLSISLLDQLEQIIFNVSECNPSDLLYKITVINDENGYRFIKTQAALIKALDEDRDVILVGVFSQELQDKLSEYFIKRMNDIVELGNITIITEQADAFNYCGNRQLHTYTNEHKVALFTNDEQNKLSSVWHEPLSKLRARLHYFSLNPNELSSDAAWSGLRYIANIQDNLSDNESRKAAVNAVLNISGPGHVVISGFSGVGKSTFVQKVLCDANDVLYNGENQIGKWLQDKSYKRKILFLDEANLGTKQWSEFEGLYYNPPGILYSGQWHPLTAKHKVIFAGNPVSYSADRKLSPFFLRHGRTVLFQPLSVDLIYQDLLRPTWTTNAYRNNRELNNIILDFYQAICAQSKTEILISPRELEMIILLIEEHMRNKPDAHVFLVTEKIIEQFKSRVLNLPAKVDKTIPSREPIQQQLNSLLSLRNWRRDNVRNLNEKQLYGGLGGIIIEGESGIGKSKLVYDTLVAKGLNKGVDFYYIPVNMGLDEKKDLLLRAFHQGAIVIIEEINSSSMLESFLNSLLMGQTEENERPNLPGFMLIGTQNPITMSGRRAMSQALQRRLLNITLSEYPVNEIIQIIENLGIEYTEAASMAQIYNQVRNETLDFKPTFRDLMHKVVNVALKVQRSKLPIYQEEIAEIPTKTPEVVASINPKIFTIYRKLVEIYRENLSSIAKVFLDPELKQVFEEQLRNDANSISRLSMFNNGSTDRVNIVNNMLVICRDLSYSNNIQKNFYLQCFESSGIFQSEIMQVYYLFDQYIPLKNYVSNLELYNEAFRTLVYSKNPLLLMEYTINVTSYAELMTKNVQMVANLLAMLGYFEISDTKTRSDFFEQLLSSDLMIDTVFSILTTNSKDLFGTHELIDLWETARPYGFYTEKFFLDLPSKLATITHMTTFEALQEILQERADEIVVRSFRF